MAAHGADTRTCLEDVGQNYRWFLFVVGRIKNKKKMEEYRNYLFVQYYATSYAFSHTYYK